MARYMGAARPIDERSLGRQHFADNGFAAVAVFEFSARGYEVAGAFTQSFGRQIGAPRVAEQDEAAAASESPQPGHYTVSHIAFVADVPGGDDLPEGVGGVDHIGCRYRHGDVIQQGVGGDRNSGEIVDLGGEHGARSGFGGGDRDQARTGPEIEHNTPRNRSGVIEQEAGEGLAAGPSKSPERRRNPAARQAFLTRLPNWGDFRRQAELDLGHQRRDRDRRVAADEEVGVHDRYPMR